MATPAEAFCGLLEILDKLEIPYSVGGSSASSVHGIPRTTVDVDLVVDLPADQIDEFASELKADFYAEREMIRDAISRGRAFNLIHFKSAYKFDLFPLCKDEFSRTEFARRRFTMLRSLGPEPIECAIASAEDTILVSSNGIAPVAKPPSGGGTIRGASCVSAATNWTGINSTNGQVS